MNSIFTLSPLVLIIAASLIILNLEVFLKKENKAYLGVLSLVFLIACGAVCGLFWNRQYSYFNRHLFFDNLSLFFSLIFLVLVGLVILMSLKYLSLQDANHGEYYALLLLALSGMLIMVSTEDLLVIFLGLEVLSISSYSLAGLRRKDEKSSESAIKYFLLGSFASAFFVLGLAFLFGAFHSLRIPDIVESFSAGQGESLLAVSGLALIIIAFGFKIAFVPFHMWTPDVYEGAPTPVTAFFSVGPKVVGFAVLARIFYSYLDGAFKSQAVFGILWTVAALTMVVGNLVALKQKNLKRMLAYSSIAHAGYLLIAILARDNTGLLFYLAVYLFMNIGAFAAVIGLGKKGIEYLELDNYAGVGFKYPWIGATFSVFLLSLAGIPPTGGFLAKFYVFSAAVRENLVPLVIIGVMASLVSVYYYLRVIVYMYMKEPSSEIDIHAQNPALLLVLFLCLYGVLQTGIFPGGLLLLIKQAVTSLSLF